MAADKCVAQVREPGPWPRYHQCKRRAVKDGFCRLHHPDAKKARLEKQYAAYEAKRQREIELALRRATDAQLHAELARRKEAPDAE